MEQYKEAVLLFNKPLRWTSFDLVRKLKYMVRAKIGHAGTLDPLATGLMILCTGINTKRIDHFQNLDKEYTGVMKFGNTTPSYDAEMEVDGTFSYDYLDETIIKEAAAKWPLEFEQSTPRYSSLFVDGKRYYDLARKGIEFETKKRTVRLLSFEITKVELPDVHFKIFCSKGFYVRSLVHDFAKSLDSGAYLNELCRTRIGDFKLEDAWTLEDFTKHVDELRGHPVPRESKSVIFKKKGFHE